MQISSRLNYWRRREAKRVYVQKVKTETSCADCGHHFHYCQVDFDHVRGEKRYAIDNIVSSNLSMDYLLEEISKCDVVCSNCHRLRTFARKHWMTSTKEAPKRERNVNPRSDLKISAELLRAKPS